MLERSSNLVSLHALRVTILYLKKDTNVKRYGVCLYSVYFFTEGETDMVISFTGIIIVSILIYNFCYKKSNKKYEEYFEEMYDDLEDYYD